MKEIKKRFRKTTEENYFDRLPTELLVSIFERIMDAKCLCICYSVCKYFAQHVVQTRFFSLEIPYTYEQTGRLPVWPAGVTNFVKKLCYVESATIHLSLPSSISKPPLVWWKSDSFGFIFVFAESRHDDIKAKRKKFTKDAFFSSTQNHLRDFMLRFRYIKQLLVLLPNLKLISAVDSMKQGSIVMEEHGIARMRKENPLDDCGKLCIKMWVAHKMKLKLKFSGCVMKNVGILCDGLIGENLLEENEYRQVAMTMMKKRTCFSITTTMSGRSIGDALYMPLSFFMPLLFI